MGGLEGLLAGHTLAGRYRIDEVIGRGGFAAVYRAHDERLQRMVAVKVVMVTASDEASTERLRARFHREARVAAQLQHRNVVTIFDFGTDEKLGLDFLVMEVLHGEDLAARVARLGPPPLDLSLRILREAAEGLAAGHQAGLVHRDVKPGNIFLEEKNGIDVFRVCVVDFGIAEILEGDATVTSLTRGRMPLSPSYAAPEHLRDERPLTRAVDVYGLGVVGYELLTGERLFEGGTDERARRTVPSLRARNPEIPEAVAEVIEKALSYDPRGRYADAGEMAKALAAAQVEHEVAAPAAIPPLPAAAPVPSDDDTQPSGTDYRARRHPRLPEEAATSVPADVSRRSSLPILLGLGLVLLLALGWWLVGRGGDDHAPAPRIVAGEDSVIAPVRDTPVAAPAPAAVDEPLGGLDPTAPTSTSAASSAGAAQREVPSGPPSARMPSAPPAATGAGRSAAALHGEGLRLFAARNIAGAVDRLGRAVELAPSNAAYRNDFGWALYEAGRFDEAVRELDEVIRIDPEREIAYANLGEVRLAQGDTAAAITQYQRFLDHNSDPVREATARRKLERISRR